MRLWNWKIVATCIAFTASFIAAAAAQDADKRDGYHGAPRTELWSPVPLQYTDTIEIQEGAALRHRLLERLGRQHLEIGAASFDRGRGGQAQGRH